MTRFMVTVLLLATVVAAGYVYSLKNTTQQLERRHHELAAQIIDDQNAIKVLKAELAYLSRPERLAKLSDRFLKLSPVHGQQLLTTSRTLALREVGASNRQVVDEFKAPLPRLRPEGKKTPRPAFPVEQDLSGGRQAWLAPHVSTIAGEQP